MPDLDDHIKRINDKLQQLLKRYRSLKKDNERQAGLIAELQAAKEKDSLQIADLKEKVNILKTATGQLEDPDKKEFEWKINQYIREIDKCISLLSK